VDQLEPHPKIHGQRNSRYRAAVECNHSRSVAPCSAGAFFSQGTANASTSGGWVDDKHPNDRPRLIKVGCLWMSRRDVGDGSYNAFVALGNNDLTAVSERGHSPDRGRHRGPIRILRPKLFEGGKGKLVNPGGIAIGVSS